MAIHSVSTSMTRLEKQSFPFTILDRDGHVDLISTASFATTNATIATIAADPSDNRLAWITAHSPGNCTLGVAKGSNSISVSCAIADVDLSDVLPGTFNAPVPQ
jgi:hypothetical protein